MLNMIQSISVLNWLKVQANVALPLQLLRLSNCFWTGVDKMYNLLSIKGVNNYSNRTNIGITNAIHCRTHIVIQFEIILKERHQNVHLILFTSKSHCKQLFLIDNWSKAYVKPNAFKTKITSNCQMKNSTSGYIW